jgi:hypothetical protein
VPQCAWKLGYSIGMRLMEGKCQRLSHGARLGNKALRAPRSKIGSSMIEANGQTRTLAVLVCEIDQLRGAYVRLVERPADKVIKNALVESFAIHARCLLEFFSKIGKSVRATVSTDLDYKLLGVEQPAMSSSMTLRVDCLPRWLDGGAVRGALLLLLPQEFKE